MGINGRSDFSEKKCSYETDTVNITKVFQMTDAYVDEPTNEEKLQELYAEHTHDPTQEKTINNDEREWVRKLHVPYWKKPEMGKTEIQVKTRE